VKVVLASGSPRRRELLAALVPAFELAPADIPEPLGADAVADAMNLAAEKARFIADRMPGALVIGADTVVFDSTRLYGKPADSAEARLILRALHGGEHKVVTGVAVACDGRVETACSIATVTMRTLSGDDIERYIGTGVPFDKAGGYAIQYDEFPVVEGLAGCYCNVMGLPLWRLSGLLEAAGAEPADPSGTFDRCRTCPDR
jgi:septum formation protein